MASALSPAEIRQRAGAIRWYQTIDLGGGVVTPGRDNTPARLERIGLPARLDGLTVLDVGAWDGFFSFEAERRGAARVLATDHYAWSGAGWGSRQGFDLARTALDSRVEALDIDVQDISPESVGRFDVVLFLGVLYHLKDPLGAIERLAAVAGKLLIVETVVDLANVRRPAMAFYPGSELDGDPTNWWAPNLACLEQMLRHAGFPEVRCVHRHSLARRLGHAAVQSWRREAGFFTALRRGRAAFHAVR
jgi:tRNA (mo5U34)-methyltransferase